MYRRPRRASRAVAPAAAAFLVWDVVAAARDTWGYNPRYVTSPRVLGLPLEEIAFFVVVPLCGLLTFEAVKVVAARIGARHG